MVAVLLNIGMYMLYFPLETSQLRNFYWEFNKRKLDENSEATKSLRQAKNISCRQATYVTSTAGLLIV